MRAKSSKQRSPALCTNHLLYQLSITIHLHLASFYETKYLKKNYGREMFIEQIIEFELRGPSHAPACSYV